MIRRTSPPAVAPPPPAHPDRDREHAPDEPEPGETLQEAEDEMGINSWLDADTGEPAEGQSPPHIERE